MRIDPSPFGATAAACLALALLCAGCTHTSRAGMDDSATTAQRRAERAAIDAEVAGAKAAAQRSRQVAAEIDAALTGMREPAERGAALGSRTARP
jgi:hypothetical protein